jgi:hypothetical protein
MRRLAASPPAVARAKAVKAAKMAERPTAPPSPPLPPFAGPRGAHDSRPTAPDPAAKTRAQGTRPGRRMGVVIPARRLPRCGPGRPPVGPERARVRPRRRRRAVLVVSTAAFWSSAECVQSAKRRRWRSLLKAVMKAAWVYAINLACEVPLFRPLYRADRISTDRVQGLLRSGFRCFE